MKIARIAVMIAALVAGGSAFAVNPQEIDVYAQMGGTLSVAISGTIFSFTGLTPSQTIVNATSINVTNDSAGFVEDYTLEITNSLDWTVAGANAPDTAVIGALFNSVAPAPAAFGAQDNLIGLAAPTLAGATALQPFVGDQDGQDVNPAAMITLWLRMIAPTTDSSSGAMQRFDMTLTAVAP